MVSLRILDSLFAEFQALEKIGQLGVLCEEGMLFFKVILLEELHLQHPNLQIKLVWKLYPPLLIKNFLVFTKGGGNYMEFSWIFTFFDSRPFQMSSSELYFITYHRPLVYFEVFSISLSFSTNLCGHQKKKKKNCLDFLDFWIFFSLVFARGRGIIWTIRIVTLFINLALFILGWGRGSAASPLPKVFKKFLTKISH